VNSPLSLVKESPKPNQVCDVKNYLPREKEVFVTLKLVYGLSRYAIEDEWFLYSPTTFFNLSLWNDPKFRNICVSLQKQLQMLEEEINSRPESVFGTRYLWLLPSAIPSSTAT
jgi:hypothetical protein